MRGGQAEWGKRREAGSGGLVSVEEAAEVAEEISEFFGAGFRAEDVVVGGVVDEFVVEFGDEAAGLAGDDLAPFEASGAVGEGELVLGAGDADVEEAAFFIAGAFGDAAGVGEDAFFEADEVDDGEFEAF